MKKRPKLSKFREIQKIINDYELMGLIVVLVFVFSFGISLAKNKSEVYLDISPDESIIEDDIPLLIQDMQFEQRQVKKDILKLTTTIEQTEKALSNINFYCDAVKPGMDLLEVLIDFDTKMENTSLQSHKKNIIEAFELFRKIRGDSEAIGVRTLMYGGRNPITKLSIAGYINEMETCGSIAQTVAKTCSSFDQIKRELEARKNSLNAGYKTLYSTVVNELKLRCETPNLVLQNSKTTLSDLTSISKNGGNLCADTGVLQSDIILNGGNFDMRGVVYDCKYVIEKHLGADRFIRKLQKIRKKTENRFFFL